MSSLIKFRLTNWEMTKGFELNQVLILRTIKVCNGRNNTLKKKYIEAYEYLTGEKFDKKLLKDI